MLSVAFSPDGKLLASGSDDANIRAWDASSGSELAAVEPLRRSSVARVALGARGRELACLLLDDTLICDSHAYDEDIERRLEEAEVEAEPSSPWPHGTGMPTTRQRPCRFPVALLKLGPRPLATGPQTAVTHVLGVGLPRQKSATSPLRVGGSTSRAAKS